MKLRSDDGPVEGTTVLGVDASTKSYAWCLIEDGEVTDYGEYEFDGDSLYQRMQEAQEAAKKLANKAPDFCAIEQAVFINNRAVVIKLAYFYGILMGEMAGANVPFDDVAPITWMNYIGNKRFTKKEKLTFKRDNPNQSKNWYKESFRELRKQRTMDWADETYGVTTDNDNIGDAVGVAHYAWEEFVHGED